MRRRPAELDKVHSNTAPLDTVRSDAVSRPWYRDRWRVATWSIGIVLLAFWVWFTNGSLGYVVLSPGPTSSVGERLAVKGTRQYATVHRLLWATVNVKDEPPPLDIVVGWLRGDSDVYRRREILGDTSKKESNRESRADMDDAKLVASIVAGRRVGVTPSGGGATVLEIAKGAPSAALLRTGDVIRTVDGTPVCLQGDLRRALASVHPGDDVVLGVQRKGSTTTTDLTVSTYRREGLARALIGITAGPVSSSPCRLPFSVSIDTRRVGGPSAGLAMTLAIIDRLSPGDLLGTGPVAVTGTIEADGSVEEVGGVKQKTLAVRAAGAKLFIVPLSEVPIAKAHAGSMSVVGVRNLDEALGALRRLGGAPLPSPGR